VGPSSSDLPSLLPGRSADQAHPDVSDPAPASGRLAGSPVPAATTSPAAPGAGTPRQPRRAPAHAPASPAARKEQTKKDQAESRSLGLDLSAVAGVEGLAQEVGYLRAAIRQLATDDARAPNVKMLAELRHQVEALCRALRTQQSLAGHDGDVLAAELAQALDELGDGLGVPQ
jgi:hypothetical protein